MASPLPPGSELRATLDRDGFVCIPAAFTGPELEQFRQAAKYTTSLARASKWPHVRTLPKQFPPWTQDVTQGIWGVQHLLHPDQPERQRFARSYFHPIIIQAVTGLLECEKDDLVLELYNMLVRPDHQFSLRWHRDDIPPEVSPEEELERLREPMLHAQWNLALYPDSSLVVVPGSHKRARTDKESAADPYEDDMPGQKVVELGAGDVLFYDNNILHRGVYSSEVERMTLHGTMGVKSVESESRARNILQHGIGSWAEKADFSDLPGDMAELATSMQKRLVEMGKGEDVGFSQKG